VAKTLVVIIVIMHASGRCRSTCMCACVCAFCGSYSGGPRNPPPQHSDYRVRVSNLSSRVSWQVRFVQS